MSKIHFNIVIEDRHWRHIPRLNARLQKAAAATMAELPKALRISCTVTILLTTDATMRRLNRDFRGFDRPTNVLSFPQFTRQKLTKMGKNRHPTHIGDIALGYQYVVGEAKKDHKLLINHVTHLIIHGVLHLFGYDHMVSAKAVQMERLETRILATLGLPDPYLPQPREPEAR